MPKEHFPLQFHLTGIWLMVSNTDSRWNQSTVSGDHGRFASNV